MAWLALATGASAEAGHGTQPASTESISTQPANSEHTSAKRASARIEHPVSGAADGSSSEKQTPAAQAHGAEATSSLEVVRANLEPSYLAYPLAISGLDPLIFESGVVAHFIVSRSDWPFAFVLTPKFVVRMFRQNSAPVKSPSYMPRVTVFFWFQHTMTHTPSFYGSVMLSHHSNGQAGPFFDASGQINHESGSFSTNFFEFSAYATGISGQWFGWSTLALEWHPGFNQNPELQGRYGLVRLHLASTVLADLPLEGQLSVRLSAILDGFMHSSSHGFVRALERFPIALRYTMTFPGMDLGLYASYYLGHDYYNIYFDRFIDVFEVGISGSVSPRLMRTAD